MKATTDAGMTGGGMDSGLMYLKIINHPRGCQAWNRRGGGVFSSPPVPSFNGKSFFPGPILPFNGTPQAHRVHSTALITTPQLLVWYPGVHSVVYEVLYAQAPMVLAISSVMLLEGFAPWSGMVPSYVYLLVMGDIFSVEVGGSDVPPRHALPQEE